ncbi:uncharacterized protein ALTATR162_LOCUS4156 [Alternaria atra]|uniref:Uncharacterized protein n=1 Tax=Alternaria atra TaxID=119953 RepID=A0A8J2I094_9PLEO|nr:uncharacterized protein ALTATR162_LOCUS4156 [Alternaria atra]CAG5156358.1 unnamed protein product [Alternaria atra]
MPVDDEYRKQIQGKVQDLLSERHEKPTLRLVIEAVVEGVRLYRSYQEKKATEEKDKGKALGFGDHFMNTYKHIKAEHEAGLRTKGMFEKALDEMRKKKTDANVSSGKQKSSRTKEREKIRKSEPERVRWAERYPGKTSGDEWKPSVAETKAWEHHRREEEEHRRSKPNKGRRREDTDQRKDGSSPFLGIRLQPPTSIGTPRRQPPPVARELLHSTPPNHPHPSAPEPPNWQHTPLQPPSPIHGGEIYEREASLSREPSARGADDRSEVGVAASYYEQAPRSPMPGSYEDIEKAEHRGYDEAPYTNIPPSPIIPTYPDTPPSLVESEGPSGSSSPIMSHASRAASPPPRFTPAFLRIIPMPALQQSALPIPPPPLPGPASPPPRPPPAPPLSAARLPNNTGMAGLLVDIQGGLKLCKVADSDKRDNSNSPRAGRVVYEETAHSHDVEEHERAQARGANNQSPFRGNSAWSTVISVNEEDDVQPESNKAFQDQLAKALQARASGSGTGTPVTQPRRGSGDSSLTASYRTSMIANVSWKLQGEKTPPQQFSKSESGEDLIFTLAAHIAQPGWSVRWAG